MMSRCWAQYLAFGSYDGTMLGTALGCELGTYDGTPLSTMLGCEHGAN